MSAFARTTTQLFCLSLLWRRAALIFLITCTTLFSACDTALFPTIPPTPAVGLPPSFIVRMTAGNGIVYVGTAAGTIKALRARDGGVLWNRTISSEGYTIKAINAALYVADAKGLLQAWRASDGSVLWTHQGPQLLPISPLMIISDGIIYVSTQQGLVEAVRASDGNFLWQYQSGQLVPIDSFVSATNGITAIRDLDGIIHIFQLKNGKSIISYQGEPTSWRPLTKGSMIYISTSNGFLQALRISDGKLLWQRLADPHADCCWTLADGILYLANSDHVIQAISGRDGKLLWQYDTDKMAEMQLVQNQFCYVLMSNGSVAKLRGGDGVLLWQHEFGYLAQGLLGAGSVLFSGNYTDSVQAWSSVDGKYLWEYRTHAQIRWQPQVANGELYLQKMDGTLDVLNLDNGKVFWHSS